jgi:ribonuclease HII
MKVAGIDEAGRGPIIGPMVMAIAVMDEKDLFKLEALGVKDSKLLTPEQRDQIFEKLIKLVDYQIAVLSPSEIDTAVHSKHMNLNWLEATTSASLINKMHMEKVFVDCPSTNPKAYHAYLMKLLMNQKLNVIAEHKADSTYVICSAASILAKVTRDRAIEKLKQKFKVDFGSGYPSDPKTKEFVEKYYADSRFQTIFRKSWETYKRLVKKESQSSLGSF